MARCHEQFRVLSDRRPVGGWGYLGDDQRVGPGIGCGAGFNRGGRDQGEDGRRVAPRRSSTRSPWTALTTTRQGPAPAGSGSWTGASRFRRMPLDEKATPGSIRRLGPSMEVRRPQPMRPRPRVLRRPGRLHEGGLAGAGGDPR